MLTVPVVPPGEDPKSALKVRGPRVPGISAAVNVLPLRAARVSRTGNVPVSALSDVTVKLMGVPSVTADGSVLSCNVGVVSLIRTFLPC